jgi:hypothetical protein
VVDGIVFWTKNPAPMIDRLDELRDYPYYFQFTVNPYGADIEPNIPSKNDFVIPTFCKLSQKIGPERMVWRYDPIILSEKYTVLYHLEYFEKLAKKLSGYACKCTFSFLDYYRNTEKNVKGLNIRPISKEDMVTLAQGFAQIGAVYHLPLDTCAEKIELASFEISHARCVDKAKFESFCGCKLGIDKDKNQRTECGCDSSIDIGAYNSCMNGCRYCYANFSPVAAAKNFAGHNPSSPLLYGAVGPQDVIKERKVYSCKEPQEKLFE